MNEFDIVIIGGGLVGLSVIAGLQGTGLRILLLEKHLPTTIEAQGVEDYRPLSLAYGSQQCLERWRVWSAIQPSAVPIHHLHVSEQGRFGRTSFDAEEMKIPALAYVVPFHELQAALFQCAQSQTNVTIQSIEKIDALNRDADKISVKFTVAGNSETVYASLCIASDGTHSNCRSLLSIEVEQDEHSEIAFIATIRGEFNHQHKAYQRFTREGSLALLPLFRDNEYRLVWTMSEKQFETVRHWTDADFIQRIEQYYGGRITKIDRIKRHMHYPLQTVIAKETIKPGFVLLGNAAHTIYPIAAQGFNLGLQDVVSLVHVIEYAQRRGQSIGDFEMLQRYVDKRAKNQKAVIDGTRWIHRGFKWKMPILDHIRGLGLLGLDTLPFIKSRFARDFLHD